MSSDLKFHVAANIFPLLEGDDLQALADDIKANGLRNPIELLDGKVIDGRNRKTACLLAGVQPRFVTIKTDDPVAYVLSHNLHRRHLTDSQRAMVAAKVREYHDRAAKERQKRKPADSVPENLPEQKGDSRDHAGAAVGVSGKSVDFATKVIKQGSKALIDAVDAGDVPVSLAAKAAELPKAEQSKLVSGGRQAIREAVKAMASITNGAKPKPRPYCDTFFAALKELSERLDSVDEQFGGVAKMFDSELWGDTDHGTYLVVEMIHELRNHLEKFDKEAQAYAKRNKLAKA